MRLNDLVHNRQSQAGAARALRLERFEDLFQMTRGNPNTRVTKHDAPALAILRRAYCERAARGHRTQAIVGNVPENLFQLVNVAVCPGMVDAEESLDLDLFRQRFRSPRYRCGRTVFQ